MTRLARPATLISDRSADIPRQAGDTLGFDAVGLGDVNGDGAIEFLLTSAWSTVAYGRPGRVFVVSGAAPVAESARAR